MYPTRDPPRSRNSFCACGKLETSQLYSNREKCRESCDLEFLDGSSGCDTPRFSSLRFRKCSGRKSSSTKLDLRKFIHQNVFIDSYYPTVLADKSQNSSDSAFYLSKSKDSEEEFQPCQQPRFSRVSFTNSKPIKPDLYYPSSKSGTTIDSKTYTLYSQISDRNVVCDAVTGSRGDHIGAKSRCFIEHPPDHRKIEIPDLPPVPDPVASLHKRLETLESLLQQALVSTSLPKQYKGRSRRRRVQKKCTAPRMWSAGRDTSTEAETRKTGNSDTEHELLVIKKRLNNLERKLQAGKSSDFKSNWESSSRNINATCASDGMKQQKRCGSPEPDGLKIEREIDNSSKSSLSSSEEDEEHYEQKATMKKHKVKKNFISKCKILKEKCSKGSKPEVFPSSKEIVYKHSEVTKKDETYCCYSLPSENKIKDSLTKVVYIRCQNNEEPETKERKRRPGKKRRNLTDLCKKNSKTNILVLASRENQTEITQLFLNDRSRKSLSETLGFEMSEELKKKSQEMKTCKKSGTKVVAESQGRPVLDQVTNSRVKVWETGLRCGSGCWDRCPLCCPPPNGWWPQVGFREEKCSERGKLYRNPLDILKRGGKIKIPVLFEELCRAPREKGPTRKASNISMRLVFVKQDNRNPLNPLKKFIQKLSQSPTPKGPYVGG